MKPRGWKVWGVVLGLWAASGVSHGATTVQIDAARAKGLAWLVSHQNSEGYWQAPAGLELVAAAEGMQAMANAGMRGMPYGRAGSWVGVAQANSVDSLARKAMALQKGGHDVSALTARLAGWRTGLSLVTTGLLLSGWGAYDHFEVSHPDTALALGALRQGGYAGYSGALAVNNRFYALCSVFMSQQGDGSWSYVLPAATNTPALYKAGAIVPTAHNILELAASASGYELTCPTSVFLTSTVLNNAANWLINNKKKSDGGFGDSVSSALDTALVYRALVAINSANATQVAAKNGALDYLIASQGTDGSWQGDAFSTALVLASLPSVVLVDSDKDGVPDTVEAVLATNAAVAGRGLFAGGTLAAAKGTPALPALPALLPTGMSTPAPTAAVLQFIKALPGIWQVLMN